MSRRGKYQEIYAGTYGGGPYVCASVDCMHPGVPVIFRTGTSSDSGCIHHIDGNEFNDAIENLQALHCGCHHSLEHLGEEKTGLSAKGVSHAGRYNGSEKRVGVPLSDVHRAAVLAGIRNSTFDFGSTSRGKPRSLEYGRQVSVRNVERFARLNSDLHTASRRVTSAWLIENGHSGSLCGMSSSKVRIFALEYANVNGLSHVIS